MSSPFILWSGGVLSIRLKISSPLVSSFVVGSAMSNPKPFNNRLFKAKWKEYEEFDICDEPDLLLIGVGKVVTTYESCETSLHSLLRPLAKDPHFTSFVFQNINSRQSRFQMLEPILMQKATGYKAKTLSRLADIVNVSRLLAKSGMPLRIHCLCMSPFQERVSHPTSCPRRIMWKENTSGAYLNGSMTSRSSSISQTNSSSLITSLRQ